MKYKIYNEYLEVEINDLGAEISSLKLKNDPFEYMWQGDKTYWNRQAPILFPIVGKLKDNTYTYEEKSYEMTQHGFARDNMFTVDSYTETNIVFKLTSSNETLKKYPFIFELYLGYEVKEEGLIVSYRVVNKSNNEMLFSIGAHPAFNWPLEKGLKEDYFFEFKDETFLSTLPISEDGILESKISVEMDGNKIWLNEQLFKNDALIFDDLKIKYVGYKSEIDNRKIEMYFDGFPYVGLWSKPTGAPFICIEPWHGIADFSGHDQKLENKKGIIKLSKNGTFNTSYKIII